MELQVCCQAQPFHMGPENQAQVFRLTRQAFSQQNHVAPPGVDAEWSVTDTHVQFTGGSTLAVGVRSLGVLCW